MAISDVQTKGSWYYIIDSNGKKSATLAASTGDLMGIGMDFIVLQKGSWYYTYDENGKKIATLASSTGDFKNAAGNSFNLKKGSWIYDIVFKKSVIIINSFKTVNRFSDNHILF